MLFAFPVGADAMRIYVKNAYGVSILLEVDPLDAIERVNQKIFDIKGSPPENMLLYFGAKQLEDGRTLTDYSILSESSLFLRIKDVG